MTIVILSFCNRTKEANHDDDDDDDKHFAHFNVFDLLKSVLLAGVGGLAVRPCWCAQGGSRGSRDPSWWPPGGSVRLRASCHRLLEAVIRGVREGQRHTNVHLICNRKKWTVALIDHRLHFEHLGYKSTPLTIGRNCGLSCSLAMLISRMRNPEPTESRSDFHSTSEVEFICTNGTAVILEVRELDKS